MMMSPVMRLLVMMSAHDDVTGDDVISDEITGDDVTI